MRNLAVLMIAFLVVIGAGTAKAQEEDYYEGDSEQQVYPLPPPYGYTNPYGYGYLVCDENGSCVIKRPEGYNWPDRNSKDPVYRSPASGN